ncbi:MAG: 2-dehydro-3-deoxy-D-gluconate 5-dehydrogenase [Firmicutes bacterium ADurb.Bin193]|nr:MAG: 2-dehydro-3-deoxy-D-gluconate 5-dehydrogenase [Firmicutes bacterium ADurb.Bin193]
MLDKKVAVITGAARGIGFGIASQLAKDGFAIAILDVIAPKQAAENMDSIRSTGQPVLYFNGDLTNKKDRSDFLNKVLDTYGRIDCLVNNAGVAPKVRTDVLETTEESFDFVMDINLKGTFFMTQAVANIMIKQVTENADIRPLIINIASMSSYTSSTSRGEYCISKAGISMITKLFADRLSEYGINVYEIRPGIIFTDMTKTVKEKYDKLIGEGLIPINRWGYPQDIANAVSVFCSGKLGYSTGEVINIDGGFHLRRL